MSGASNEYRFLTRWRLQATTCAEITEVLSNAEDLARWWPSVYLTVKKAPDGRVTLHTKGWLPYTLRWSFVVTERHDPHGFSIAADGDFVGTGRWDFSQDGASVDIVYDWRIRADKPLLRWLSFVMKPLFSWNHRWAMRQGERSLAAELQRRGLRSSASASSR